MFGQKRIVAFYNINFASLLNLSLELINEIAHKIMQLKYNKNIFSFGYTITFCRTENDCRGLNRFFFFFGAVEYNVGHKGRES